MFLCSILFLLQLDIFNSTVVGLFDLAYYKNHFIPVSCLHQTFPLVNKIFLGSLGIVWADLVGKLLIYDLPNVDSTVSLTGS